MVKYLPLPDNLIVFSTIISNVDDNFYPCRPIDEPDLWKQNAYIQFEDSELEKWFLDYNQIHNIRFCFTNFKIGFFCDNNEIITEYILRWL